MKNIYAVVLLSLVTLAASESLIGSPAINVENSDSCVMLSDGLPAPVDLCRNFIGHYEFIIRTLADDAPAIKAFESALLPLRSSSCSVMEYNGALQKLSRIHKTAAFRKAPIKGSFFKNTPLVQHIHALASELKKTTAFIKAFRTVSTEEQQFSMTKLKANEKAANARFKRVATVFVGLLGSIYSLKLLLKALPGE